MDRYRRLPTLAYYISVSKLCGAWSFSHTGDGGPHWYYALQGVIDRYVARAYRQSDHAFLDRVSGSRACVSSIPIGPAGWFWYVKALRNTAKVCMAKVSAADTMHNETPVRQGEFGRRSGFLLLGIDPHTNQESGYSRTFLRIPASFRPHRCYCIRTNYIVGMTTPRPKRRVTASKRALEALEASQALPTPQSTTIRKRQRVYRDPIDDDDLDRYSLTQVEAMQ
jgi:hypothetical protein